MGGIKADFEARVFDFVDKKIDFFERANLPLLTGAIFQN